MIKYKKDKLTKNKIMRGKKNFFEIAINIIITTIICSNILFLYLAKQNNVDLGKPYNYMILNKTASVAVLDEKATAKN